VESLGIAVAVAAGFCSLLTAATVVGEIAVVGVVAVGVECRELTLDFGEDDIWSREFDPLTNGALRGGGRERGGVFREKGLYSLLLRDFITDFPSMVLVLAPNFDKSAELDLRVPPAEL